MQLIHELEPDARGPYSGVYGSGRSLRCVEHRHHHPHHGGAARPKVAAGVKVQAGAEVVADSKPDAEYEETLNKARGMLTALACLNPPVMSACLAAQGLRGGVVHRQPSGENVGVASEVARSASRLSSRSRTGAIWNTSPNPKRTTTALRKPCCAPATLRQWLAPQGTDSAPRQHPQPRRQRSVRALRSDQPVSLSD